MSESKRKNSSKIIGRIARHKNVRYHNDAYLFPDNNIKICPSCKSPFDYANKWPNHVTWQNAIYCSKDCKKRSSYHLLV